MSWKRDTISKPAREGASWRQRLTLLGVLIALGSSPLSAVEIGAALPPLSGYDLEGGLPADLSGKVMVVDFWASWCAPCKASFPTLSAVEKEFSPRGVVVIGVSVDEKQNAYDQFRKRLNPAFHTVRDRDHKLAADVKVPTMPTTLIVDRKGKVRFIHAGFHEDTPTLLRQQLQQLLEEKS